MADEKQGKYKILVVDDDTDILTTITLALEGLGQTILVARDGLEAVDVAAAQNPDILVLDLMLPKRGGFLILQRLKGKQDMRGKRPLICMMTGNEGSRHKEFAERLGVDDYLRKPFPMGRLVDIAKDFIAKLDAGIQNAK
jgi:DNA-binding response OmpR family regulator